VPTLMRSAQGRRLRLMGIVPKLHAESHIWIERF
jgi:hypothetical protein